MEEESLLFTCDFLGCHYCDGRLFNDAVGDFRFSFEYYFEQFTRPFRPCVVDALDLIEPLGAEIIAPGHGPILRTNPKAYITHCRRLVTSRLASETGGEKTLLIFYISAYRAQDHGNGGKVSGVSQSAPRV